MSISSIKYLTAVIALGLGALYLEEWGRELCEPNGTTNLELKYTHK